MAKWRIIVALVAEIDSEKQIDAVKEFLNSLPDSVKEIRVDKIIGLPWKEIEEEEEED